MSDPTRHVMFSPSAAGTLKKALSLADRPDEVLCLFDDFSFGPIATDAAEDRIQWVEEELGCTDWKEITDKSEAFLARFAARFHRISGSIRSASSAIDPGLNTSIPYCRSRAVVTPSPACRRPSNVPS